MHCELPSLKERYYIILIALVREVAEIDGVGGLGGQSPMLGWVAARGAVGSRLRSKTGPGFSSGHFVVISVSATVYIYICVFIISVRSRTSLGDLGLLILA